MLFRKKIFGLDISDNSIEVMLLSKFLGQIKLISYGRKKLEGEVVKDGIIKKSDILAKNITEVLRQAKPKPIEAKECILSLPESKVYTHIFNLPVNLDQEQIKNSLPYEAEKIIPFSTDQVYFDFKIINKDDKWQQVFYTATEYHIIEAYQKVLSQVGLEPVAFDLESISLARSLISKNEKAQGILIIDLGARSTNLNIFYKNAIYLSKVINIAGNRFTKTIAKELKISEDRAERLKAEAGFDPNKDKGKLLLILQKEFRRIIKEAKAIIEYFESNQKTTVKKIILVGGSSLIPKVTGYLTENLGLEVSLGNPFTKLNVPKDLSSRIKSVLFANVVGLALRGVAKKPKTSDINLLAIKAKKFEIIPAKEEKKVWKKIYISAAIFVILIILFGFVLFIRQKGVDIYQMFFQVQPVPPPELEVSEEELENLRQEQAIVPTTTPEIATSTEELVESTKQVLILDMPTGFLNVRSGPGLTYEKLDRVTSGDEYPLLEEQSGWYKIKISDDLEGWVFSEYVTTE